MGFGVPVGRGVSVGLGVLPDPELDPPSSDPEPLVLLGPELSSDPDPDPLLPGPELSSEPEPLLPGPASPPWSSLGSVEPAGSSDSPTCGGSDSPDGPSEGGGPVVGWGGRVGPGVSGGADWLGRGWKTPSAPATPTVATPASEVPAIATAST